MVRYTKALLLCTVFLCASCGQDQATVPVKLVSAEAPKLQGLEIPVSENRIAKLDFVIFDASKFTIEIVDNGKRRSSEASLLRAVEKTNAVVGINAGFFNVEKFTPQGMMISNRKRTGKLEAGKWPPAVLGAKQNGDLFYYNNDEHQPDDTIQHLVQAGPWLVKDRELFKDKGKIARRSFIGTDGKGKWIIGVCTSRVSLFDLTNALVSAQVKEIIDLIDVINLDGGPSTGFVYQTADVETFHFEEGWTVRNFLFVVPKSEVLK